MYASTTIAPLALRTSAATASLSAGACELRVPFTGALTSQTQSALTCALRQRLVELRYGTRLRGLTVSVEGDVLLISPIATRFALSKWLDSGELVAAVEAAARQARITTAAH